MKKKQPRSPLDRISHLPDNVTDIILGCLSIRDAVRTSILSKNWKEKWMTVPHIVLDSLPFDGEHGSEPWSLINHIVCRHKGAIRKLRFSVDVVRSCYDIRTLIYKLSPSCIQDFSLEIWRGLAQELPPYLFSYTQLTHLKLRNVKFQPPSSFKGFSSLTTLDLDSIVMEDNNLKQFIHSCPLLERLTLTNLGTIQRLDIDAQNLKYFLFNGEFKYICLSTPLLLVLSINMNYVVKTNDGFKQRFKILDFPRAIEKLSVKPQFSRFLALDDIARRRHAVFNHLKTLEIDKLSFKDVDELKCLISLIERSPNLESLSVSACTKKHSGLITAVRFWEVQESDCFFEQLRRVSISSFVGESPELEFIRYVLYKSPLLEEMTVKPISDRRYDEKTVTRKLMHFPRASPRAGILYLEPTRDSSSDSSDSSDSDSSDSTDSSDDSD